MTPSVCVKWCFCDILLSVRSVKFHFFISIKRFWWNSHRYRRTYPLARFGILSDEKKRIVDCLYGIFFHFIWYGLCRKYMQGYSNSGHQSCPIKCKTENLFAALEI